MTAAELRTITWRAIDQWTAISARSPDSWLARELVEKAIDDEIAFGRREILHKTSLYALMEMKNA